MGAKGCSRSEARDGDEVTGLAPLRDPTAAA